MRKIILSIVLINTLLIGYTFYSKHVSNMKQQELNMDNSYINQDLLSKPLQEDIKSSDLQPFKKDNFLIIPVKRYKIAARILRRKEYTTDPIDKLLPVDFALGWNIMADLSTIEKNNIKINQSNRFYFLHINNFDNITEKELVNNSANVHISPYNEQIQEQINNLKKSDIIYLEGFLIDIKDHNNNYRFRSSLIREDTGAGACEIFLVTKVKKYERYK